jgi:DNA replication and repair protein RecF
VRDHAHAGVTAPLLARLHVRSLRNLEPLDWSPGPGRHLLLGDNGAGKTSVLESVYILATTRSFRTPRLADCVRHSAHGREDADGFEIVGEVEGARRARLSVRWSRFQGLDRAVNDKNTPLSEHLSVLPVVAWTAGDVEMLTGAPALRRRFLDRGVVSTRPAVLEVISRYRQALTHKRDLLGRPRASAAEIAPWDELLADAGAELVAARARYAERLAAALAEVVDAAGVPFPPIGLDYRPSPRRAREGADAIREMLARVAERERRQGMPLLGPHRDDLAVTWGGRPVKGVASAGETKALSVLMTVAHGKVLEAAERTPVYLLDDLDAELAAGNLARVWRGLGEPAQLIASSNRPGVWEELAVEHRWRLAGGRLEAA